MGSRAGKINVVNVCHAVGRYERDALAKDVERWFESEYGGGALSVSSNPTRRDDGDDDDGDDSQGIIGERSQDSPP